MCSLLSPSPMKGWFCNKLYPLWFLISPIYFVYFERTTAHNTHFWTVPKSLDGTGIVKMVLMDLSKAFDCLPHDLIAKLEAYGSGIGSLQLIFDYLTSQKKRVRINSTNRSWLEITSGVPQGSVLDPLLFNIYMNDLTFFIVDSDLCNFADDNALYSSDFKQERVISRLENDLQKTLVWFESDIMVANLSKFQFMFMGLGHACKLCIETDEMVITTVQQVKLLGVQAEIWRPCEISLS